LIRDAILYTAISMTRAEIIRHCISNVSEFITINKMNSFSCIVACTIPLLISRGRTSDQDFNIVSKMPIDLRFVQ